MSFWMAMRIGISSCLLGMNVRYDGGHKLWPLVGEMARAGVTFVPLCPEAECGLGVPREVMRLEGVSGCPVLKTVMTRQDLTGRLHAWAVERLDLLAWEGVNGFLLKSRSPSCGVFDVPIHDEQGMVRSMGMGLFARACQVRFPDLVLAEGDRMSDWSSAQAFLQQVARSDQGGGVGC